MTRRIYKAGAVLLALALMPILAVTGWAGDSVFQGTAGQSFFSASPPCPVKRFPTFEALVPVPSIIDPFEQDFIPMFCQIQVQNEGKGVKKAKGKFETELIVIDNSTGMAESFPIKSGAFRTDNQGRSSFDFELPAELFADGFESGDVSAWSYTRTEFTNKKKANNASTTCQSSSSRSQRSTWTSRED